MSSLKGLIDKPLTQNHLQATPSTFPCKKYLGTTNQKYRYLILTLAIKNYSSILKVFIVIVVEGLSFLGKLW